jgi:hypothetical protein
MHSKLDSVADMSNVVTVACTNYGWYRRRFVMRIKRALPISRAIRSCTTVILGHCVLVHVFRLWRTFAHTQVCHLLKSIYSLKDKIVCLNSAFWNCNLKNRLLQFANNTGQLFSKCWCAWYTRDSIFFTWAHGLMCVVYIDIIYIYIFYVYIYISIFPTAANGFWTLNFYFHQVFFYSFTPTFAFFPLGELLMHPNGWSISLSNFDSVVSYQEIALFFGIKTRLCCFHNSNSNI